GARGGVAMAGCVRSGVGKWSFVFSLFSSPRHLRWYSRWYFLCASNWAGVIVAFRLRAYSRLYALSASSSLGVRLACHLRRYLRLYALSAASSSGVIAARRLRSYFR